MSTLPVRRVSTWEGSRRPSGAIFEDAQERDLIVWVDAETEKVRCVSLVEPQAEGTSALWESLQKAMEYPLPGSLPYRPDRVLIDDPAVSEGLRGLAGRCGIAVAYQESLPMLDAAYQALTATGEDAPVASSLGEGTVTSGFVALTEFIRGGRSWRRFWATA